MLHLSCRKFCISNCAEMRRYSVLHKALRWTNLPSASVFHKQVNWMWIKGKKGRFCITPLMDALNWLFHYETRMDLWLVGWGMKKSILGETGIFFFFFFLPWVGKHVSRCSFLSSGHVSKHRSQTNKPTNKDVTQQAFVLLRNLNMA